MATKVPSNAESFDIYGDNNGLWLSFWSDVLPVVLVQQEWYAGTTALIEYYLSYWKSWLYVFGFPVFLLEFWVWKWNLADIIYNQDLYYFGVEWMQDNYLNNFEKMVEYHYM